MRMDVVQKSPNSVALPGGSGAEKLLPLEMDAAPPPAAQHQHPPQQPYHERQSFLNCGKHTLNSLVGEHWATTELLHEVAQKLRQEHATAAGHDTLVNPYHHWAGAWVGNWDIMVLCEALKRRQMAVTQHVVFNPAAPARLEEALAELCAALDEVRGGRGETGSPTCCRRHHYPNTVAYPLQPACPLSSQPETVGIILNRESRNWFLKMISGHHWYALARETEQNASTGQVRHVWYNKDSNLRTPEVVGDGFADAVAAYVRSGATTVAMQAFLVQRKPQSGGESGDREGGRGSGGGGGGRGAG